MNSSIIPGSTPNPQAYICEIIVTWSDLWNPRTAGLISLKRLHINSSLESNVMSNSNELTLTVPRQLSKRCMEQLTHLKSTNKVLFCFVLGIAYSGLTSDSVLGDHSLYCLGEHIQCQGLNLDWLGARQTLIHRTISLALGKTFFKCFI